MSLAQKTQIMYRRPYLVPSAQKDSDYEKNLKTEAKKLSLPEGRAYKVLQKSVQKKSLLYSQPQIPCLGNVRCAEPCLVADLQGRRRQTRGP